MEEQPKPHPDDEVLEAYIMKILSATGEDAVSSHLLVCEECRDRCQRTEEYVRSMRDALSLQRDAAH